MSTIDEIASIYQASPTPNLILKPDAPKFTVLAVNDAFLSATQTTRSSLIGKSVFNAFPTDSASNFDIKNLHQAFDEVLKLKKPHKVKNYKYILVDAKLKSLGLRYWRIDTFPLLDQKGDVEFVVQTLEDITYVKLAEERTKLAQQRDFDLFNFSPVPMWAFDINTLRILAANDAAQMEYGYTLSEFLHLTVKSLRPAADVPAMMEVIESKIKPGLYNKETVRHITKSGKIIDVVIESKPLPSWGMDVRIIVALDITAKKRLADLESLEKKVLELSSTSQVLVEEVLSYYVKGIESLFPQMHCAIMQVKYGRLYNWVSISLPTAYTAHIEGLLIGDRAGSCGTAAFLQERIIVTDIKNDIRWLEYREMALKSNLLACWSEPIINSSGEVMATFAIYYNEVMQPDEQELKVITRASSLLKVILESRQNADALKETTVLMAQAQQLAHFGNWSWDLQDNTVSWSDTLFNIYGVKKEEFNATFEGYLSLVHRKDQELVSKKIQSVISTHEDAEFEERIIRPGGEVRYLRSWAKLKFKNGKAVKMIGACLDITESKKIQKKLLSSESRLRSLVDAQTNYVIRTDLDGNYTYYNKKYREDFGWLYGENDFLGYSSMNSVSAHSYEPAMEVARLCIQNPNKVYQIEIDKPHKKGGTRSTLWHFIVLTDSDGNPSEIQCIGVDITERKKAEDAIKQHNVQLKEIAWAQTHLVRAPLARILALVDLLQEPEPGMPADPQVLHYLHLSAAELDEVIRRIIDKSFI